MPPTSLFILLGGIIKGGSKMKIGVLDVLARYKEDDEEDGRATVKVAIRFDGCTRDEAMRASQMINEAARDIIEKGRQELKCYSGNNKEYQTGEALP